MGSSTLHNPDRFMGDLRQVLSQGRKRVGIFLGAGAPTSIRVGEGGQLDETGSPLIPDVAGLTTAVVSSLTEADKRVVQALEPDIGPNANVEVILTRVRRLGQAIGAASVHGIDGEGYRGLSERICTLIGSHVRAKLPEGPNPLSELASWIAGTYREHAVEVFTPNYDLLTEEAFERARIAYFDGFAGAHEPFFDPVSISSSDELPSRWARLWKLHGSLGWDVSGSTVVRTGSRDATSLIYPDHLKYDEVTRLPYSALFERLRAFLTTPDSILVCSGFSFGDAHITALFDEALAANAHTAILAFQYGRLDSQRSAIALAANRPNLSVYARDGAVINGIAGDWRPGEPPNDEWLEIRATFWQAAAGETQAQFLLGDFAKLARFFSLTQSQRLLTRPVAEPTVGEDERAAVTNLGTGIDNVES